MTCPLRLEFAGAICHVTARGDRREDIYLDDDDRVGYLTRLQGQVLHNHINGCSVYSTRPSDHQDQAAKELRPWQDPYALSFRAVSITARGDRREDIYFNTADRQAWLTLLGKICERFNWVCHAYCLMTNHYHLVVETLEGNLAQGMRQLNGVYTQYVNRTHRRVGHVFQGRYQAILVEKDRYLLELARYVILNPVRARMVKDTAEWAWSSYHTMIGQASSPPWFKTDWILGQFGSERQRAIACYIDFVRAGVHLPTLWENLQNQIYLGSEQFVQHMQKEIESLQALQEVPRVQRRPVAKSLDHYARHSSDPFLAMARAYLSGDYTMKAIADHFGVHYTTVSRAVKAHGATESLGNEQRLSRNE